MVKDKIILNGGDVILDGSTLIIPTDSADWKVVVDININPMGVGEYTTVGYNFAKKYNTGEIMPGAHKTTIKVKKSSLKNLDNDGLIRFSAGLLLADLKTKANSKYPLTSSLIQKQDMFGVNPYNNIQYHPIIQFILKLWSFVLGSKSKVAPL